MLVIRDAQMQVFRQRRERQFEVSAVQRWQSYDTSAPDGAAGAYVRQGIEKALTYGLTMEAHILQFLDLLRERGAEFDEEPSSRAILADSDLTAPQKLALLQDNPPI